MTAEHLSHLDRSPPMGGSVKRRAGLQPRWPDRLAQVLRSRRRGGRRFRAVRRLLAAALLIAAGVMAVAARQGPVPGVSVVAVNRDLPAGTLLSRPELSIVSLTDPPGEVLRTAAQAVGHLLAAPVRRGEVLTDVRLVSASGPTPGPGRTAVPVRLADPSTVDLLSPGVHVAVLAVAETGKATVLSTDAVVLAIPPPPKSDPVRRLVVLSVPRGVANAVTAAAVAGSIAIRFA